VWVRDNVHVAHHLAVVGEIQSALRAMTTLSEYFSLHRQRFVDIVEGRKDPSQAMNRPHVRITGETLSEVAQRWNHKQNDALGYFVWLFVKLVLAGQLRPNDQQLSTLALFPAYFAKIEYWHDEDSGHWEEWPKIEASSIGVVVAALRALRDLKAVPAFRNPLAREGVSAGFLEELIHAGEQELAQILPWECVQPELDKQRDVDSALLFLIYPVCLVKEDMADRILGKVRAELEGEIGIARYKHDTFWCPDYKRSVKRLVRTDAVSEGDQRKKLKVARGDEAQWCIFDPIVSCIYARRFLESGADDDLDLQIHYLNRSLLQLTAFDSSLGPYQCPEAYYLSDGKWVPNDATPLLWTQANLRLAMHFAQMSAEKYGGG
jgi:phosphorylase kinase alpha/beta subunit